MAHGVGLYRPIQDTNDIVVISLTFVVCKSDKTNVSEAIREAPALRTPNCIRKIYHVIIYYISCCPLSSKNK